MAPNLKSVINLNGQKLVSGMRNVSVFKYYCDTVLNIDKNILIEQMAMLKKNKIHIALECAPLSEPGYHLESFGEPLKILKAVDRVASAGGQVSYVALDEPIYYAHYSKTGKMYVGWSIEKICSNASLNILPVYKKYPEIQIGLIEPINRISQDEVFEFMKCFSKGTGNKIEFFHADVIWSRPDAWQSAKAWGEIMSVKKIRYGVIFNSTSSGASNDDWIKSTESNINVYFKHGGKLSDGIIQSWNKEPQFIYPQGGLRSMSELPSLLCNKTQCGR